MLIRTFIASICLSLCLGNREKGTGRRLQREVGDLLFFGVTYRDFLGTDCLTDIDDFEDEAEAFFATAYNLNSVSFVDANRCENIVNNEAWEANLIDGVISAHPDFEALNVVDAVVSCSNTNLLPIGSCINDATEVAANRNQPILLTELDLDTDSGVPKPVYCSEGETDTCGTGSDGTQSTSTKKFFDMWYNDDPIFNKRIGQRLAFQRNDAEDNFFFNADVNEAPDFGEDRAANFFGPLGRFRNNGGELDTFIDLLDFETNPIDAEAWPIAGSDESEGFWFTTELHTTFEFQDANMNFKFSGDDDFWAFINGQLVIALPGVHSRQEAEIDLLSEDANGDSFASQLGLVVGQVYTLDIYHAERHFSQSNFDVTTSLAAACNVLQSGSNTIDFTDSSSIVASEFVTNGVDLEDGQDTFFLTRQGRQFQATSIFTKDIQNLEPGFIASFTVTSSADIPNGFAFVIQADGVVDLPVSTNDFNFGGITNSLAVVFDLCRDRDDEEPTCDDKEIRLHFPNNRNAGNSADTETQQKFAKFYQRNFERGALANLDEVGELFIEVIYFGGEPDFLEVYVNHSLYLRETGFDIVDRLGSGGGHVGFTATTSFVSSDLEIRDFVLETVLEETDATRALFDPDNFVQERIVANGNFDSDGFTFQTVDFCDNDINSGGLADDFTAIFTLTDGLGRRLQDDPDTEEIEGTVTDNNDGSYTVTLNTLVVGNFSLDLSFGDFNFALDNAYEALAIEDADLLNEDAEGTDPLPFVYGGVGIFVCCGFFTFLFVSFRNDWYKNKRYIEQGAEFKREMNTTFAGTEEYSVAGKKLLQLQMKINALRAKGASADRDEEIEKLEKENKEMLETLKSDKQVNELQNLAIPAQQTSAKKKNKYKKLDFTI